MIEPDLMTSIRRFERDVYLDEALKGALPPYVVIQALNAGSRYTLDPGETGAPESGLFELSVYHESARKAALLADQIICGHNGRGFHWKRTIVSMITLSSVVSGRDDMTGFFVRHVSININYNRKG